MITDYQKAHIVELHASGESCRRLVGYFSSYLLRLAIGCIVMPFTLRESGEP
jgi:hypothetical protein